MVLSVPLEDASTSVLIDPFLEDRKGREVGKGRDKVQWIVQESRSERNEPDQTQDEGVDSNDKGECKTALWSNRVDVADMEKPAARSRKHQCANDF